MHIASWLRQEFCGLLNFLLPPACALCLERLTPPEPDSFCPTCRERILPVPEPRCPRCALPFPANAGPNHFCQACLNEKRPSFAGVFAVGQHEGLLREAIHRLKYRGDINLDRPLGVLLADTVRTSGETFDLVVPVPLHPARLRQRGYNQSALLARQVAGKLRLAFSSRLLVRTRQGTPQKEMSARERRRSIRGAFAVRGSLDKARILLVDDVMTTGATATECARTLLSAGASLVQVAVLARAPLK